MDYVVANGGTDDLWIYFGKGDGTFQLPKIIPLTKGQSPVFMVTADLRKTGNLDLVVAEFDTQTVGILLGNGDGTFQIEQEYALPLPPATLVVNDFNHDGKLDVVAVMNNENAVGTPADPALDYIATLIGDGTGKFSSTPVITQVNFYGTPWNVDSGDVNHDGLPDLVIAGIDNDDARIYLNNGDGSFHIGQTLIEDDPYHHQLFDGRFGDLNEDGCLDAVTGDFNSYAQVFLGDCAGNFTYSGLVGLGDANSAVRLVDLNGDGHLDIVTTAIPLLPSPFGDVAGNTLSVAFGDGHGNFTRGRDYVGKGEAYSLASADFNGDGKPDIVTSNTATDTTTVYLNDGGGGFGFPQGVYVGLADGTFNAPATPLSFADMNGDGKPDVLLMDAVYGGYTAVALLNDGTGRLGLPVASPLGFSPTQNMVGDYRLGDFRNSGHLDLIAIGLSAEYSGSTSFILFAPGKGDGSFGPGVMVPTAGANGELTVGDFNHDGKLDIVVVSPSADLKSKMATTYLGNGDGTFVTGPSISFPDTAGNISRVYAGDFNRDGKLDILVYDNTNGYWSTQSYVWEFLGNGDGSFQAGRNLFTFFQPFALADLNGDKNPDILQYNFFWPDGTTTTLGPPTFTAYLNKPDGTFGKASTYAPYAGMPMPVTPLLQSGDPTAISIVGDFNGDGIPDAVAFQQVSPLDLSTYAQILMGNGDGTFTPTYDIFPFDKSITYPKYAHDLDGDGFADLVELDGATSSLHILKGGPAPAIQIELNESQVTGTSSCGLIFANVPTTSDRVVTLSSSISGVTVPSSITIPAGALSQQFCYTLSSNYDWHQVFDIRAGLGTDTAAAYASQNYVFGFSEALSSTAEQVVYPGNSTTGLTLSLTSSQGYASTVHLHCDGLPVGATCTFGSDTLMVSPSAVASTTVVVHTTSTTRASRGPLYVVASDANVTVRKSFTLTVYPLVVVPPLPLATVSPGTTAVGLFVLGIPPYKGSCSGLPAGVKCNFAGAQLPYPSESDLALTVSVPGGIAGGTYPFSVSVASGGISTSVAATLNVIDFTLSPPSAASAWAPPGGTVTVSPMVQPINNLTNTSVTLTCSLDSGGTCTGVSSYVSGDSPWAAPLTVSIPPGTATGTHTLSVTMTAGSLTHTISFPLYIADYSGSLSATSIDLAPGGSGSLTATLNVTAGFGGTLSFSCVGSSQITCSGVPATIQPSLGQATTVKIAFSAGLSAQRRSPARWPVLSMGVLLPCGVLLSFGFVGKNRGLRAGTLLMLVAIATTMIACGGSAGGGSTSHGSNTYSVVVGATAAGTGTSRTLGTVAVTVTH